MRSSETVKEIIPALVRLQKSGIKAEKDSVNPIFRSKYTSLDAVLEAIKGPLADEGLVLMQEASGTEKEVHILTKLYHTTGEWLEFGPLILPVGEKEIFFKGTKTNLLVRDAQSFGSAITYGKRYAITSIFGIQGEEDDDGNKTSKPNSPPKNHASESEPPVEVKMDGPSIHKLETELVGYDELRSEILNAFKVIDFSDIKQSAFPKILTRIRERKEKE